MRWHANAVTATCDVDAVEQGYKCFARGVGVQYLGPLCPQEPARVGAPMLSLRSQYLFKAVPM